MADNEKPDKYDRYSAAMQSMPTTRLRDLFRKFFSLFHPSPFLLLRNPLRGQNSKIGWSAYPLLFFIISLFLILPQYSLHLCNCLFLLGNKEGQNSKIGWSAYPNIPLG